MNIDGLNKWLTLTANVGVFAGLLLVAYEINQTQKQFELATLADHSDNFTHAMELLAEDEDLAELIYRAENVYAELDDFERWRVSKYLDGFMIMSEQDYLVLKNIEEDTIGGFKYDWKRYMMMPHFRAYWSKNEKRFGIEFQSFVNQLLTPEDS